MKKNFFAVPVTAAAVVGLVLPAVLEAQSTARASTAYVAQTRSAGTGDTVITIIRRGDGKPDCTVRVGDRVITGNAATAACERAPLMTSSLREDSLVQRIRLWDFENQRTQMAEQLRSFEDQRRLFALPSIATAPGVTSRAIIGVTPETRSRDTDRYGAYITAVTPGGPAARAGLRSGDIITKIGDVSLGTATRSGFPGSAPSNRLIEVTSATLEVGKPVSVEYRRSDRTSTVMVTPIAEGFPIDRLTTRTVPGALFESMMADTITGWGNFSPRGEISTPGTTPPAVTFAWSLGSRSTLRNAELAPMNEGLRSYFGTGTGVLVVNLPEDQAGNLGLLPGDVILEIGGRAVSTPVQFFRILSSYDKGEEISLQVMRQKSSRKLSTRIP